MAKKPDQEPDLPPPGTSSTGAKADQNNKETNSVNPLP